MNKQIDSIKRTRSFLLSLVSELPAEQLNEIPPGFNNNIIWNIGHLTAAQQGICYLRAGAKPVVDEKLLVPYRPGTKPDQFVDAGEVETLKQVLLSSLDRFETDYQNNVFANYTSWTTRYGGVELANIDDAIQFLLFHEGLHSGYISIMKRLVKK